MDAFRASRVARKELPALAGLLWAREQARWQKANAAGEHKKVWTLVLYAIDLQIESAEARVTEQLGLLSFRAKRVIK